MQGSNLLKIYPDVRLRLKKKVCKVQTSVMETFQKIMIWEEKKYDNNQDQKCYLFTTGV